MEISRLSDDSIKLKGKTASLIVNPEKVSEDFQGALYLTSGSSKNPLYGQGIAIDSPGEYEIGGVKIKGVRKDDSMMYTMEIDGVNLIIGKLSTLEKMQGKYQDLALACIEVDSPIDPSFMSTVASSYLIYFGKKADELSQTFLKGEVEKTSKLSTTKEKLPQDMQTILFV